MNETTLRSIRIHHDGYCSQRRKPLPPIRKVEEGVAMIGKILEKKILCRHDVNDINKVYKIIDNLEKRLDSNSDEGLEESKSSSIQALDKVIERVKQIAENADKNNKISSEDLIALYHLQNFSDKDCGIDICFNTLMKKFQSGISATNMATHLPYCDSTEQFRQDVKSLLPTSYDSEANKIVDQKIWKLIRYHRQKNTSTMFKSQLDLLRYSDLRKYPLYLDELLDKGYTNLYGHLAVMGIISNRDDRHKEIMKMTFSEVSHVVLETREAIIQQVENSIPTSYRNILFLLGGSGSGKTTAWCSLRGDTMILSDDSNYQSKSDKNNLIGEGSTSYTFLPNVEIMNDWVLVDFPGFADTNGQIISMGMEFALKYLIKKYHPKIVVLESIAATIGRGVFLENLNNRLNRLFDNKENCRLGITKYSQDFDFMNIRNIEKQQLKERSKPTEKESKLVGKIELLSEFDDLNSQTKKVKLEKELEQLRLKRQNQPLADTEEKRNCKSRIEKREQDISKEIGLKNIIQFQDLEDSTFVSKCMTELSQIPENERISLHSKQNNLDEKDEKLLKDLFENHVKKEVESEKKYVVDFNIKDFEQSVKESSLTKTYFSHSNPEIGEFLHLPEMDPKIVRKYDEFIVKNCIREYMKFTISTFDKKLFDKIDEEITLTKKGEITKEKVDTLNKKVVDLTTKWNNWKEYVRSTLKIPLPKNPQEAEEQWQKIEEKYSATIGEIEKEGHWFTWIQKLFNYESNLYNPIRVLFGLREKKKIQQQKIEEVIDECGRALDQSKEVLLKLKDIEKITENADDIDKAIESVPISMESFKTLKESIEERINQIRSAFGCNDWDMSVEFKAGQFSLTGFDSEKTAHADSILALAYIFIVPDWSSSMIEIVSSPSSSHIFIRNDIKFKYREKEKEIPIKPKEKNYVTKIGDGMICIFSWDDENRIPTFVQDLIKMRKELHPLTATLFAAAILSNASKLRKTII